MKVGFGLVEVVKPGSEECFREIGVKDRSQGTEDAGRPLSV